MKDLPSKEYYCDKIHTSTGVDPGLILGCCKILQKKLNIEMM